MREKQNGYQQSKCPNGNHDPKDMELQRGNRLKYEMWCDICKGQINQCDMYWHCNKCDVYYECLDCYNKFLKQPGHKKQKVDQKKKKAGVYQYGDPVDKIPFQYIPYDSNQSFNQPLNELLNSPKQNQKFNPNRNSTTKSINPIKLQKMTPNYVNQNENFGGAMNKAKPPNRPSVNAFSLSN